MANSAQPLLIKRYASRRLYNTETSDYVTLEDISGFIRDGREVRIVDLKSGDDLTRQYLLQIIADHESRGENVLPINVLNDLVRSYTTHAHSIVPDFLTTSFEMLRDGQSKVMENISSMNPMASMPGFEMMKAQQEAFVKAMTGNMSPESSESHVAGSEPSGSTENKAPAEEDNDAELSEIKSQLAELQAMMAKLGK